MVSLRINLLNFYVVFLPRVLFICFIVIDSLNGYLQEFYNLHTPIGVLSRGIMLLLISSCVFVKINLFIYKLFKLLVWVYLFAIPLWYINGSELIFFREVQYLFRFIYFFCILFYFSYVVGFQSGSFELPIPTVSERFPLAFVPFDAALPIPFVL